MTATSTGEDATAADGLVLETSDLTKRFGSLFAVDGVDLAVDHGEFRSIIGPNGAGKTTLFDLLTGAQRPTAGTVRFRGEDVTRLPPHERVRRGMGRSFQITNVFGGLTVRENVRLAAQAGREPVRGAAGRIGARRGGPLRERVELAVERGRRRAGTIAERVSDPRRLREEAAALYGWFLRSTAQFEDVDATTAEILDRIGLAGRADETASALAYGDRRRLEIGIVLASDPAVVLLDEPTAGMSDEQTHETLALIDEVLADRTLLLIEHDIDLVMDVSDRITVLHRGQELATGSPAEIADDEHVQEAYLGGGT